MPLLHKFVTDHVGTLAPAEVSAHLQRRFSENARRNLALTAELLRLTRLLGDAGVAVGAFKGPVLAVQAYGDVRMRRFADLDVFLREGDVERAQDVLAALGFRRRYPIHGRAAQRLDHQVNYHRHLADSRGIEFELHYKFAGASFRMPLETSDVWGRLDTASLNGLAVRCLAPEDALLVHAVHATRHHWGKLEMTATFRRLLDQPTLDRELLERRADGLGLGRVLRLGVALSGILLGGDQGVRGDHQTARDRDAWHLAHEAARNVLARVPAATKSPYFSTFQLRSRERRRDRVLYFLTAVFKPNEKDAIVSLPARLGFLYYLIRPIRLIVAGASRRSLVEGAGPRG